MAEEGKDQDLSSEEAAELERLLDADEGPKVSAEGTGGLKKVLSDKKKLMKYGMGFLILLICIGAGAYFFWEQKKDTEKPIEDPISEVKVIEEDEIEVEVKKVHIYKLKPFFLPIRDGGKESGQFITMSANLLLSNSILNKEIDKILPSIRKNIFNILKSKRPDDFNLRRSRTKEGIKKEILTASNALLLSGTGNIKDVLVTRFMIK